MKRILLALFAVLLSFMAIGCTYVYSEASGNTSRDIYYSYTWVTNGGTWLSAAPVEYLQTAAVILPTSSDVYRYGYTFDGWYTSSDFSGTAVNGWDANGMNCNITLYAKWTQNANGITVTLPGYVSKELVITSQTADPNITLTATEGFDSYVWRQEGMTLSETSNIYTINTTTYAAGTYNVLVIATKDGKSYSATAVFTVQK